MAKRSLVPETGGLRVVAIRWAGGGLVIEVEPREPAQCPRCGAISTSRQASMNGAAGRGPILDRSSSISSVGRQCLPPDRPRSSDPGRCRHVEGVIDILPDRAASSVEAWMRNHPDIEYVVRDRDGLYAEGATKGAPQAKQLADRFHLLQNLRQTIEAELAGTRAQTGAVSKPPSLMAESGGNGSARTRMAGRDMRELMFNRVRSLHEAGESAEAIRLATGLGHHTVRKWIRLKTLPTRQRMAPKTTTPSAFEAHLRRR
jgi:hypothetical protein